MPPAALRPRSIPELLDATFALLRQHYVDFVAIAAVLWVPVILVKSLPGVSWQILGAILSAGASAAVTGAVILLVSQTYLGEEPTIAEVLRGAFGRLWSLVLAGIYQGLLVLVGFILLVIPAFIFFAWAFAMPMVIVLEGRGVSAAFTRSRELARGNILRILLTLGAAYVLVLVVSLAFGAVAGALILATGVGHARVLVAVLTGLGYIVASPIYSGIGTMLYYDLRMRKEGFDLEMMAGELGAVVA